MSPAAPAAAPPMLTLPINQVFGRHRAHGAWQCEFALGFERAHPGAHNHVPVALVFARIIKRSSHLRPNRSQPFATATGSLLSVAMRLFRVGGQLSRSCRAPVFSVAMRLFRVGGQLFAVLPPSPALVWGEAMDENGASMREGESDACASSLHANSSCKGCGGGVCLRRARRHSPQVMRVGPRSDPAPSLHASRVERGSRCVEFELI